MDALRDISASRQTPGAGSTPLRSDDGAPRASERADAARQFEAYLLKLLLAQMRKTVGEGGLLQGESTSSYQPMFEDALATRAAENGSFGLAEQLLRQWDRQDPEPNP